MQMTDCALTIGLVYGTNGILRVIQNDTEGWSDISGGVESYLWISRLCYNGTFYRGLSRHPRFPAVAAARIPLTMNLLCCFVALGDEQREKEVWSLLDTPLRDEDAEARQWWYERPFESFFVMLYAKAKNLQTPFDEQRLNLGIYRQILEHWEDDTLIAKALEKACDYHLAHLDNTRDRDAEFGETPFDLLPVEILAIERLRSLTGRGTTRVNHPLMRTVASLVQATPPRDLLPIFQRISDQATLLAS
jgi:hypothetical protein